MKRTERAHIQVAAISHPGMTGKNNEDRFAVSSYQISQDNATSSLLAVLCDGIGGHRAGEIAADLAVNTISQIVAESDGSQPIQILQNAIQEASQRIHEQAQENDDQYGMGSTCACAWLIGNRLYIVSVGDSRIYLQRGDGIYQLTIDHTWVQELLERGQITPEQVHQHPNAHVIRRYLGSTVPPDGDFRLRLGPGESDTLSISNQGMLLRPGDRVLLCSDGLTDMVEDGEIRLTVDGKATWANEKTQKLSTETRKSKETPEQKLEKIVQNLVDLANQRGGHDNITIILMQIPENPKVEMKKAGLSKKWRQVLVGFLGLAVFVLLAGTTLFGLTLFGSQTQSSTVVKTLSPPNNTSPLQGNLYLTETTLFGNSTTTAESTNTNGIVTTRVEITMKPTLTPWPTNTLSASNFPLSYIGQ